MNSILLLKALGVTVLIGLLLFAFSLFDLMSQVARYKSYWDRNNQQPAVTGEILYVALGDSTAQGIGATQADKGYPAVIRRRLAAEKNTPVRLVNLSKSGAKLRDALDRQMPALEQLNPNDGTVVTIEIGANDMINFDPATFEADMDELMGKLPSQTVISDIPYFGGGRFKSKEPDVVRANEIMYRLAAKHSFKLAPLHEKLKQNGGLQAFAADWFHPSNMSYRENWAPVFLDSLSQTRVKEEF